MEKVEERHWIELENKGQKVFGVLHLPLKEVKVPAVLICHGLAGHKTGKFRLYVSLAKRLAQEGIAALRIDYRGSGDSEGEFIETTLDGVVSDAMKGLEFLSSQSRIDPMRIGIFGRSFGGAVAILASNLYQNIKSLGLWAPIFNGDDWLDKWNLVKANAVPEMHKTQFMSVNGQTASMAFFEQFFKMRIDLALQNLKMTPLLHIQGAKDATVSANQANHYVQHRTHAKGENKFIRLPEADHDFSRQEDRQQAIDATTNWFSETL